MTRNMIRRFTAALLAAQLLIGTAFAAPGQLIRERSLTAAEGTRLDRSVFWSQTRSDRISENYIEYEPNADVTPMVAYGRQIYGRASLDYVTNYLSEKDIRVVAGINADFFEFSTGVSLGTVIAQGMVAAATGARQAVGFFEDGTAIIGDPGMDVHITGEGWDFPVSVNKESTVSSGVVLYTRHYASGSNMAEKPAYNIMLSAGRDELAIGDELELEVTQVFESEGAVDIPEGHMLLSIRLDTQYTWSMENVVRKIQAGEKVTLKVSCDEAWSGVRYAVGGGDRLIDGGVVNENLAYDSVSKAVTSRTAIGIKDDGSVIFYTVDGLQSGYSAGMTLAELADRMAELGCVDALNLDGGGSTVLGSRYPGDDTVTTVGSPSDGKQRMCANYIFLVNNTEKSDEAERLFLYPYDEMAVPGGQITYTVKATDSGYNAVAAPDDAELEVSGGGSVDGAVYTAGQAGTDTVNAYSGDASGSAKVTVIGSPTDLAVISQHSGIDYSKTTLYLDSEQTVDLTAKAEYNANALVSQDDCFIWQADEAVGTVDENGLFSAAMTTRDITGQLTVSCGDTTAHVDIVVQGTSAYGAAVEGFENTAPESDSAVVTELSLESDLTKVKYGYKSLKLGYDFSLEPEPEEGMSLSFDLPMTAQLSEDCKRLGLWVYGDGSGNKLMALLGDGAVEMGTIDFYGWRYLYADTDGAEFGGLRLVKCGADAGTMRFDQLIASNGEYLDENPPVVGLDIDGLTVKAAIIDDSPIPLGDGAITLKADGSAIDFTYDGGSGVLTADVSGLAAGEHKISVTAVDACGNIAFASESVEISAQDEEGVDPDRLSPFEDMHGHWAEDYTTYLYEQGIVSGIESAGGLSYQPDSAMTRAQFAVIMCGWLGTDKEQYAQVELPFSDLSEIPEWALPSVRAMYALGVVKGVSADGGVKFSPSSSITRAEAMTMIGRTLPRGYKEAELTGFGDAASVADWAAAYVRTLVGAGVVSGVSGSIQPAGTVTRAQVAKMLYVLI